MATADKLDYLLETKNQIKEAIREKGVGVEDADSFRSYASKIGQIKDGGTGQVVDDFWNLRTNRGTDGYGLFAYTQLNTCNNVDLVDFIQNMDTSKMTTFAYMFADSYFDELDLSGFDTGNVTNMRSMFDYCKNLTKVDLSGLDTSNVETMENLFYQCSNLTEAILNNSNTSKVSRMANMFGYCPNLTVLDLSSFDTSKVTTMANMFIRCKKLIEIKGILDVIKVTSMSGAFSECVELIEVKIKNLNCANLNLSACTKLSYSSLIYLINNLVASDTVKTITLGSTNLAKLTDEEKAIAINKNWTLS